MTKPPKKKRQSPKPGPAVTTPPEADFEVVLHLIDSARSRAVAAVNTTLIELYWTIGEFITRKIANDDWDQGTVEALMDLKPRSQVIVGKRTWKFLA